MSPICNFFHVNFLKISKRKKFRETVVFLRQALVREVVLSFCKEEFAKCLEEFCQCGLAHRPAGLTQAILRPVKRNPRCCQSVRPHTATRTSLSLSLIGVHQHACNDSSQRGARRPRRSAHFQQLSADRTRPATANRTCAHFAGADRARAVDFCHAASDREHAKADQRIVDSRNAGRRNRMVPEIFAVGRT